MWALIAIPLLAAVVVVISFAQGQKSKDAVALDGKLLIVVRPPDRGAEAVPIDDANALPVREGHIMSIQVEFNQPALAYLVWLDAEGNVTPLYPWNHDALTVRDIDQPPPNRKATNVIYNPPIGGGWKFGSKGGLETVLLLARRTHLEPGTQLGPIFATIPRAEMRHRQEVVMLGLNPGSDSISLLLARNRELDEETSVIDEPLRDAMRRLRDHFEFIRVARFAHEEK